MENIIELIKQPWHWSIAGILIGLTVPILLILGNKKFGVSSSLRHICAATFPAKIPFFQYDWKKQSWNLFFVLGVLLGGWIAVTFLQNPNEMIVAEKTKEALAVYGITDFSKLLPTEIFSWQNLTSINGWIFMALGGFMVGFGTRWAGGCTSGHAIMGLSNLQIPSLIATICFMLGGFIGTHLLLPLFF